MFEALPNDTDFTRFAAGGLHGYDTAITGGGACYHSPLDDPQHLNPSSLQQMGTTTLAVAHKLAGRDLADVPAGGKDVVMSVPWSLVRYPGAAELPLALATLVLAGAVARSSGAVGRSPSRARRRPSWWRSACSWRPCSAVPPCGGSRSCLIRVRRPRSSASRTGRCPTRLRCCSPGLACRSCWSPPPAGSARRRSLRARCSPSHWWLPLGRGAAGSVDRAGAARAVRGARRARGRPAARQADDGPADIRHARAGPGRHPARACRVDRFELGLGSGGAGSVLFLAVLLLLVGPLLAAVRPWRAASIGARCARSSWPGAPRAWGCTRTARARPTPVRRRWCTPSIRTRVRRTGCRLGRRARTGAEAL